MKVGGQILWNVLTYLRNVTDLLSDGKTPYERRFGQPFKGPIIPFGSLVEYNPITAKDQSRIHQFGKKKSYLDCSSDTLCTRVEFGNDVFWLQTLRSWEIRRVRNPCSKRLKRMNISYSQSQMEQQNCLEEIMSPRIHSKKTESTRNERRRISRKLGDVSSDRNKR